MGLTFAICLALSIYAVLTSSDFSSIGAGLSIALIIVAVVSLLSFFLPRDWAKPIELAICGIMIFLMGLFIIYDLQLIVGGRKHQYDIDDYIVAAMNLYVDVMMMFVEILKLLNLLGSNND